MIPRMPFNELIGLKVAKTHEDGVTLEIALKPELKNGAGVMEDVR